MSATIKIIAISGDHNIIVGIINNWNNERTRCCR